MKKMKEISLSWRGSKKPKKQRKFRANAPLHVRHRLVKIHLSKQLREKHNRRSMSPRVGDKVKVLRGRFKGKEGALRAVNLKRLKVSVNGLEISKNDGTKVFPLIDPSNLLIVELKLDDKARVKILERKKTENGKKTSKAAR